LSASLRYLSHVRRGMARSIGEVADASGVPRTPLATVDLAVTAGGEEIKRTLAVRGPGSIVALAPGEVLRVEPPDGSRDAAPNLFPNVELRTADLPWRFTPARPKNDRLIPWLVLVVVEDREGVSLTAQDSGPEVLTVDDPARELPDLTEAWAWAHAQVHAEYDDLGTLLAETPELATARLMCPRYLEPDTGYIACVVPSFEAGRLVGLGLPAPADPIALAWTTDASDVRLPVFHSWRFRTTAEAADFEELVRRLQPAPLGPDVGVHDLDLSRPGTTRLPNKPVVVGYEGALGSPEMEVPPWRDPGRSEFQSAMGELLADAAPGEPRAEGEPYIASRHDPVVAPPRYGMLAAGIDEIPEPDARPSNKKPRWLSEANLDPKYRAAAGLGAEVVRLNQEALMADAWDQALGLRRVNRLLARTRLALEVGRRSHARVAGLSDGVLVQVTAGAHARMPGGASGRTLRGRRAETALPAGVVSAAFRRASRPGSALAKATTAPDQQQAVVTGRLTEKYAADPDAMLRFTTLLLPFGVAEDPVKAEADAKVEVETKADIEIGFELDRLPVTARLAPSAPAAVEARPVDSVFGPLEHLPSGLGTGVTLAADLELGELAGIVRAQLEPTAVLGARLRSVVRPADTLGAEPVPASLSASPLLLVPLYRKLVNIDPELLMPGVRSLPPDSVGLAVVNQASVEAFLLGANHALASELAWREYPADLAGTWLRTFWDSGDATEDIQAVDSWRPGGLGTHWSAGMDPGRVLVLVIKGDLLRRYPNTLITAVPARWNEGLREEDDEAAALDPVFTGSLGSDAVFLGFEFEPESNQDVEDLVAGSDDPDDQRPGWYFAFEEPPTEPSYGLDTAASDESPALRFWKDLTWDDARVDPSHTHVDLEALGSTTLPYDEVGENDWEETWAETAAGMARITLQRPVRMLVHADQMLVAEQEPARA
jgi:hypothetical protein